jgi:hypothetical protein
VKGFTGAPNNPQWLSDEETLTLLEQAEPSGELPFARKQITIERVLSNLPGLDSELNAIAQSRAGALLDSHRRVRAITKEGQVTVQPQLPMDILGIYYFQPE